MVENIDNTIIEYLDLVKKTYPDVEVVYLFGSYAKGKSTADSDIDIALVFKRLDDSKRFDLQVQLMLLAAQIDSRIEPHPLSQNDFNSGNPFVAEIKKSGIEVLSKTI